MEVERYSNGGWEDADRLSHGNGAEDGWYRSVCMKESEWRMGGIGAFVRRNRSGGWEVTNRLYGAVGEKSIDFLKILYRLFRKTL